MSRVLHFAVPRPIAFGPGAIRELRGVLAELGVARPFLVTDAGVRAAGILDRALEALGDRAASARVFDRVSSNPTEDEVLEALALYRDSERDGLVALGGGSPIDAAKAVALLASHPGRFTDYDLLQGGAQKIVRELPALVAVPTTAGTGSEVSRGTLIVTRRRSQGGEEIVRKTVAASPRLVPRHAILDPELTLSLPPRLTAGSGMDALSHAVEELSSPRYHPVVAAIASDALARLARDLPRVWLEPQDVELRGEMLMSAMMGGIGFEKGLGAIHSLSHAIGALRPIHHGLLNAVLLPAAIAFNREHFAAGVPSAMARAAGLELRGDGDGEAADRLAAWLSWLCAALEIPPRLRDIGVRESDRAEVIARALEDHCHRTNPRRCGRDDFEELWENAW